MVSSSTRLLLPRSDRGVGDSAANCRPEFSYNRTHRLMVEAETLVRPEAGMCHRCSLFSRIRSANAPGSSRVQTSSLMPPRSGTGPPPLALSRSWRPPWLNGLERECSSFLLLPSTGPFGQGYKTVGWLSHGSILLLAGSGDRDEVASDQAAEIVRAATTVAAPKERKPQAVHPSPSLTLSAAGQVRPPAAVTVTGGDRKQDFENGRTYSAEKAAGAETDNAAAVGVAKAAQIHRFSARGERGKEKPCHHKPARQRGQQRGFSQGKDRPSLAISLTLTETKSSSESTLSGWGYIWLEGVVGLCRGPSRYPP